MKLLILGIDAMEPSILFKNQNDYKNMGWLCQDGVYGEYDAYAYGYGSRDNWISLYTGLTPGQHGTVGNTFYKSGEKPIITDYEKHQPFWKILNEYGIKVGMWKGLVTTPPQKIDGYMISGEANFEIDGEEDPYARTEPVLCGEDDHLRKYISFDIKKPPMPKSPEEFGYTWELIYNNPNLVDNILNENYFNECVSYFQKELTFYENNMVSMQTHNPVDVMFFYTPILDFIQHFTMHDPEYIQIKRAMKILDDFVGRLMNKLNPENVIILSDHGMTSLDEFFPDTPTEIQKEAFGWRDKSIWLKNGKIVTRARNGGFMSGIHSLKGCFIASGKSIGKGQIKHMRTIDFYPTLLEMFNIEVPSNREGYVHNIFKDKGIVNTDELLKVSNIEEKNIAIIQSIDIPQFNKIINEVFLDNRFNNITVFGEEKYKGILQGNPRVSSFVKIENKKADMELLSKFDKVIIPYLNNSTNEVDYIEM